MVIKVTEDSELESMIWSTIWSLPIQNAFIYACISDSHFLPKDLWYYKRMDQKGALDSFWFCTIYSGVFFMIRIKDLHQSFIINLCWLQSYLASVIKTSLKFVVCFCVCVNILQFQLHMHIMWHGLKFSLLLVLKIK